jgi:hypothetical protein
MQHVVGRGRSDVPAVRIKCKGVTMTGIAIQQMDQHPSTQVRVATAVSGNGWQGAAMHAVEGEQMSATAKLIGERAYRARCSRTAQSLTTSLPS